MSNLVDRSLRESASKAPPNDEGGSQKGGLWYRVEREIVPLLLKIRSSLNSLGSGFGSTETITSDDSPFAMTGSMEFIRADASGGVVVVNLPASADTAIRFLSIKKLDSTGNSVTVTAADGEDLDGGATAPVTIAQTFIRLIPRDNGYDIA